MWLASIWTGSFTTSARYNGKPASGLAIKMATGANALDTADNVKRRIDEMSVFFRRP